MHNEWSDRVEALTRLIRDQELSERVRACSYVIFLATLPVEQYVTWVLLRGVLDVEDWLVSWLRRESAPAADLPRMDEIQSLVRGDRGTISLEPLNDRLQQVAGRRPTDA